MILGGQVYLRGRSDVGATATWGRGGVPAGTLPQFAICTFLVRMATRMFLQEHLDLFCTQFTCVHSNSSLHLKYDADYAAQ
jgi:hypothetical protein